MSKDVALEITVPSEMAKGSVQSLMVMMLDKSFLDRFTHVSRLEWAGESDKGDVWHVYGVNDNED